MRGSASNSSTEVGNGALVPSIVGERAAQRRGCGVERQRGRARCRVHGGRGCVCCAPVGWAARARRWAGGISGVRPTETLGAVAELSSVFTSVPACPVRPPYRPAAIDTRRPREPARRWPPRLHASTSNGAARPSVAAGLAHSHWCAGHYVRMHSSNVGLKLSTFAPLVQDKPSQHAVQSATRNKGKGLQFARALS